MANLMKYILCKQGKNYLPSYHCLGRRGIQCYHQLFLINVEHPDEQVNFLKC